MLENGKITRQYEGITNMFNPPKYGDYDPNAVMAPWYWLIFGLMMGDAGYGLMMLVIILAAKKIMKPKGGTLALMNVMLYSSVPTIVCGILFGSYFGEELFPAVLFTPLNEYDVDADSDSCYRCASHFHGHDREDIPKCERGKGTRRNFRSGFVDAHYRRSRNAVSAS